MSWVQRKVPSTLSLQRSDSSAKGCFWGLYFKEREKKNLFSTFKKNEQVVVVVVVRKPFFTDFFSLKQ